MKFLIGIVTVLAFWFVIIFVLDPKVTQYRVYDCGMAEWHPDIPNAVKEECRRRHYEEWKNEQRLKQTV